MDFKKLVPHLIGIAVLLVLSAVFFAPNAFSGKVLPQGDNEKARGMQTEIQDYLKKEGKAPLWTNSAFGGMPGFQIYSPVKGNLTRPLQKTLFLWTDMTALWAQVFVAMLCMYLFLTVLRADWRVAVFGALAFGITSYNVDILEAGHSTKMASLALAPGIFAGIVLTFNGRLWLGAGLTALFVAMQILTNHVQITYYTLLLAGLYFLARLIDAARQRQWMEWGRALGITLAAIALGFACNISRLWSTYEYGQETIRGQSELSQKASKGDGLDKDYLFGWSYGVDESLTLLVPHYAGGGSNENYTSTAFYKRLRTAYAQQMNPGQAAQQTAALMYTGTQPFVGTAIYFGAIVCFLFLLGAFLVPGSTKWWLLAGGIFTLMLAWGKNFVLNDLLYETLPMFNKFRAVSMALGMGQLCFAALAALGLQALVGSELPLERKKRALLISAGASLAICLLIMALADTSGARDNMLAQTPDLLKLIKQDRNSLVRADALRSMGFIAVTAAILWFYLQGRLKAGLSVVVIALLALADHWLICRRTLTNDKYENKRDVLAAPPETEYDKQIKQDKDPHYRVLDLARGGIPFNGITSYYHKSLSGYHAAKLQRFQEVVDTFLTEDLNNSLHIVGMLNGKYIVTQDGKVITNPKACGNAWFVRHVAVVPDGDAELRALGRLSPCDSAVVQQSFASILDGLQLRPDSTATIRLSNYHPDRMEYEYSASSEQLAVFSEIYYPPAKGWKCFINGEPAPDFIKADYLLRAMRLPAGQNMKLEMRFEPRSYYLGENISLAASIVVLLTFFGGLYWWFRRQPLQDANRLVEVARPANVPERPVRNTPPPPPAKPRPGKKR